MMRLGGWMAALALSLAAGVPALAAPPEPRATIAAESTRRVLVLLRLPPAHYRGGSDYSDAYGDEMGRSARRRIGAQLARTEGLELETDWAIPLLGVDCLVMAIPDGRSETEVAASIARDERVAWAEPMKLFHAQDAEAAYEEAKALDPKPTEAELNRLKSASEAARADAQRASRAADAAGEAVRDLPI